MSNTIFVSAYMARENKSTYRNVEDYIIYGKKLLEQDIFQVIYIEKNIFMSCLKEYIDEIKIFEYENKLFEYIFINNKIFVFFEKEDNYLYKYKEELINFQVTTDNPTKDTTEYMFIQCHKTEWMKITIYLLQNIKLHKDELELIWLDFGIYHMIKDEYLLKKNIKKMINSKNNKIRIGSCWDVNNNYNRDLYRQISWYFAGTVFGGNSKNLIIFADLMKEKCLHIIEEKKTLTWEVNIWYMIFQKNKDLFNSYLCDHNISILENY
jgi:hypothetical protein